jgi:hypothetical protein
VSNYSFFQLPLESTLGQISEPETPYGTSSILWGLSDYRSLRSYHPGSGRTLQLWQIFLDNVHPLSKVLHTLSIQRQIIAATLNLDGVSRGLEALMFVIYLSAVNSLKPSECESILGERRDILHKRYLSATKQAFVNCECLKSCSFIVLQSLTLYLVRRHETENNIIRIVKMILLTSEVMHAPISRPQVILASHWTSSPKRTANGSSQGQYAQSDTFLRS